MPSCIVGRMLWNVHRVGTRPDASSHQMNTLPVL